MRKINFVADDATLMGLALEQAAAAADRGDPGFGAVVAREGETVAAAGSTELTIDNPLAHDGLTVLRRACRRLGSARLPDCTYYGTAEPCLMCSAALLQTQIRRVVIAASGADLARLLGPRAIHLEDLRADYGHQILIDRGLRHDEGLKVLARSLRPR
jgi:tRNA(Arg) A34 adenosine deaminase TadA